MSEEHIPSLLKYLPTVKHIITGSSTELLPISCHHFIDPVLSQQNTNLAFYLHSWMGLNHRAVSCFQLHLIWGHSHINNRGFLSSFKERCKAFSQCKYRFFVRNTKAHGLWSGNINKRCVGLFFLWIADRWQSFYEKKSFIASHKLLQMGLIRVMPIVYSIILSS